MNNKNIEIWWMKIENPIHLLNKLKLWFDDKLATKDYIEEVKNELFLSLEAFPYADLAQDNVVEYIKWLEDIFGNDEVLNKFSNLEKWKIYYNLWESYLKIWKIWLALDKVKKSIDLWFKWGLELYIMLDLINQVLTRSDNEWFLLYDFENELNEITSKNWNTFFLSHIRNDLENFLFWDLEEIKKPNKLEDYLYNFELKYERISQKKKYWEISKTEIEKEYKEYTENLQNYASNLDNKDLEKFNLYINYQYPKIIRWDNLDYIYFSLTNKQFLEVSFYLIETFILNDEIESAKKIFSFVIKHWLNKISLINEELLLNSVVSLFKRYSNIVKEFSDIFYDIIDWRSFPINYSLYYIDILLSSGDLSNATAFLLNSIWYYQEDVLAKRLWNILIKILEKYNNLSSQNIYLLSLYIDQLSNENKIPNSEQFYDLLGKILNLEIKYVI